MEFNYATTLDDYVAFCLYFSRRSTMMRAMRLVGWFMPPAFFTIAAIAFAYVDGFSVDGSIWIGFVAICAIALSLVIYPFVDHWITTAWLRSYAKGLGTRGTIGPIKHILNEDSLIEITETTKSEVKWRDMVSIEEVGDYTFIMVTGMSAAILPRHGFACEQDYVKVRDFAKARVGRRD